MDSTAKRPFVRPLGELFALDLRSIALYRIALGVLILCEIGDRLTNLNAFYTDTGILPRGPMIEKFTNVWHFSLHHMSGLPQWQVFLFAIEGVAALCLIVGFQSRVAVWIAWFLQLSVQARNPMILQAGDVLFRLLLLWGGFLPLGARWSFDAVFSDRRSAIPAKQLVSVATIAIFCQVSFIYFFTVMQKTGKEWLPEGSAVYYALNIDILATRAGVWLRQFPDLMHTASIATFYAEALLPFLLFCPIFTWQFRMLGVLAIVGMHASFGIFLELGNFPWIDMISVVPLIPSEIWDWLERRVVVWGRTPWWRHWDLRTRRWRAAAFDFFARLWRNLPLVMRAGAYRVTPTVFAQVVALILLWISLLWNLSTVPKSGVEVPESVRWIGNVFRLDQQWAMFSPFPMKDDGWYVIEGQLKDRKDQKATIDVLHQKLSPPSFDKPELGSAEWSNQRWRKYMMNIWVATNSQHRLYYARWICRTWNHEHGESAQLEEFTIFYMREDTLPDRIAKPEKVSIWHHFCFK